MRNFAKIIELEDVDCLVYRDGGSDVVFRFRFESEDGEDVLEPSATMGFRLPEVVDTLFTDRQDKLREKAEKAWATIKEQYPSYFTA